MKNFSILLIDDEQNILDLLTDILELQGYQITVENNSVRALELIDEQSFDLVITDLMMPEVSGLHIAQKLRRNRPHTRIIILTGHGSVESASRALELGVDGYLQKPIHNHEIIGMVEKVLAKKDKAAKRVQENKYKTLLELSSLLYQVKDFDLALDMISDTCTEYLDIRRVGLAFLQEDDKFKIVRQHNLHEEAETIVFDNTQSLNDVPVQALEPTCIGNLQGKINIDGSELTLDPRIKEIHLFPISFREKVSAYLIIASEEAGSFEQKEEKDYIRFFCNQVAPVLSSFKNVKKTNNAYENIISKIIKDRVYESRLGMNPISFALIRIVAKDKFEDSLILDDAIRQYQSKFVDKLQQLGNLIWLTVDTAFFIFPNADLFKVETLASDLKNEIETITLCDEQRTAFTLKYACMSYPQSGEYAAEIINNLWLKLFDEIYFMQN